MSLLLPAQTTTRHLWFLRPISKKRSRRHEFLICNLDNHGALWSHVPSLPCARTDFIPGVSVLSVTASHALIKAGFDLQCLTSLSFLALRSGTGGASPSGRGAAAGLTSSTGTSDGVESVSLASLRLTWVSSVDVSGEDDCC